MKTKPKAMIVSVGGKRAPVIFSLNQSKPKYICFFVSEQTRRAIKEEILPALSFKPDHHDWVVTKNPELLSECYFQLAKKLPEMMVKWELEPKDVCVDYTGGTKTMSVALAMATVDKSCCYSYVGGDERSKGGVGIVIDGKEKMHFLENPWDQIALSEKKEASILFNKARYDSAGDILEKCVERVSREHKPFFKALHEMVLGYALWDRFKHSEAKKHLYRSRDVLTAFGSENEAVKKVVEQMEENLSFLEKILETPKPSHLYCLDLLANAQRRAGLEHKYDDAVARLYRSIETLAQAELKESFGIDTSNVKVDSIPERLREEYLRNYQSKEDHRIKLPLYASYRLLSELGGKLGKGFFEIYEKEFKPLLSIRNNSILAHGFNPVDEGIFQKLFDSTLKFSEIGHERLLKFPTLNL